MKIGILQAGTSPDSLSGDYGSYGEFFVRLLANQSFAFEIFDVENMAFPPGPEAADGWLITGSRHSAYDDLPFIAPLEALIRDIQDAGLPLVGICFGHQIIAQALGGKVEKHAGGWMVGPQDYDFGGQTLRLNAWHQDQVTRAPEGAEVIATLPGCPLAGLQYGRAIWTVQPHPEMTNDFMRALAEARGRGLVPDPLIDAALAAPEVTDGPAEIAQRIGDFFRASVPA